MTPDDGTLLVVEDEPFLRKAVVASLRFLGFEVTDEQDGARDLLQERRDVGRISLDPVQQVGWGQDGEALSLELGRNGVPARSVGPCSVDEYRRGRRCLRAHAVRPLRLRPACKKARFR